MSSDSDTEAEPDPRSLQQRVAELEQENKALNARLEAATTKLDNICRVLGLTGSDGEPNILPMLEAVQEGDNTDVISRVEALERGEVDVQAIGGQHENDLPIQRMRADVKAGRDDLSPNQARATEVWAEFPDQSFLSRGDRMLTSADVREILDDAGAPSDPQTAKRVMKNLENFSDGLLTHEVRGNERVVYVDEDEWRSWLKSVGGGDGR
jgi:hypothetical protein